MKEDLKKELRSIRSDKKNDGLFRAANILYMSGACQILSQGKHATEIRLQDDELDGELIIRIAVRDEKIQYQCNNEVLLQVDKYCVAALLQLVEEIEHLEPHKIEEGKAYTREGMMKRVLTERRARAETAEYRIRFANNMYGEHLLTNEKGQQFRVTLRDFEKETGYIDNADLRTNKLGTTKHIMYAFAAIRSKPKTMREMDKTYPFLEIYLDPLNDYRITWFYPHALRPELNKLIRLYFGESNLIADHKVADFLPFIKDAEQYGKAIKIRAEVDEKVRKAWDLNLLQRLTGETDIDFSLLKTPLFPYQQDGVRFASFRAGAIIADEMGLGKTIQAIGAAVMKKKYLGFAKTLVVCPASLKDQWKREVMKFMNEAAVVVEGTPAERAIIYKESSANF